MKLELQNLTRKRKAFFFMHVSMGTILILFARYIYFNYPFYQTFISLKAKEALDYLFWVMLVVIWLDAILKLLFKSKLEENKFILIFIFLYSCVLRVVHKISRSDRNISVQWNNAIKIALLSTLVKFFYIPIMLNFATGGGNAIWSDIKAIRADRLAMNFDNIYSMLVAGVFLVDTSIFAFGYAFESRWLGSEIRSVEPTLLGWVAALSTYPPFNTLTGQIFPLTKSGDFLIFDDQPIVFIHIVQILILLCHLLFVSASIALWTKASNLTNRGIVSRGPYRVTRHPAYTAKLLAWALTGLLYGISFSYYIFWFAYVFIYGLRAWTEERHLSMDPDYIKYKENVRYRVLPGVF